MLLKWKLLLVTASLNAIWDFDVPVLALLYITKLELVP